MLPTAKQLIGSVVWSLDERVAPLIDDKWGASTLRSLRCLLMHLSTRVEVEGQLLFDDNADLTGVSREIVAALSSATDDVAARRDQLAATNARTWRDAYAYPTVASMAAENDARREAIDRLLRVLATDNSGVDPVSRTTAVELIDAYLRRRLARDQPLFAPAFMASTY